MSNKRERLNLGLIIVGALFVAIGIPIIFDQNMELYPFRDAGIVIFIIGILFIMAGGRALAQVYD